MTVSTMGLSNSPGFFSLGDFYLFPSHHTRSLSFPNKHLLSSVKRVFVPVFSLSLLPLSERKRFDEELLGKPRKGASKETK